MNYLRDLFVQAYCSLFSLAHNRRGADSLEWIAVAVVIVGAVILVFGIIGTDMRTLAKNVTDAISAAAP